MCRVRKKNYPAILIVLYFILISSTAFSAPPSPYIYDFGPIPKDGAALSPRLPPPRGFDRSIPAKAPVAVGMKDVVVILIEFSDVKGERNEGHFRNLLFGEEGSLYDYYREVSYKRLTLKDAKDNKYIWYQVEETLEYWGADGERVDGGNEEIYELARKAVKLADEDIDFSKYDGDGDGVVDHVLIIHAGGAQEDTGVGSDIWSHRWEIGEKGEPVDGVKVFGYIMVSEHSSLGIIAHEFGHDLGLPDLYNTENGQSMIGSWGLMDLGCRLGEPPGSTPSHPCCWSKVQLGWIEPEIVDAANIREIYQIESYNTNSLYKLMVKDRKGERDEYFLVTNRQKWGFDKFLPGVGLLIWHIDDSIGSIEENNVNTHPLHPRVYLEQADGRDDLRKGCKGDEFDPFYEGNTQSKNPTSFGTNTKPDSRAYDGSETGIEIVGISAPGEIMYANKLIWLVSPEDGEMLKTLYFEWRAFKDAESYKIKIDNFRDFNSPILEDVTPLTQYTPEEGKITPGGYYWIVEGYAGNELIAKSEIWAFWYGIEPLKDVSSYPFPNPFKDEVKIKFKLSKWVNADEISLKIFNLAGEFIKKIKVEERGTPDNPLYIGEWNGCNEAGQKVASGLYFYLISAKKDVIVGKVAIVR